MTAHIIMSLAGARKCGNKQAAGNSHNLPISTVFTPRLNLIYGPILVSNIFILTVYFKPRFPFLPQKVQ